MWCQGFKNFLINENKSFVRPNSAVNCGCQVTECNGPLKKWKNNVGLLLTDLIISKKYLNLMADRCVVVLFSPQSGTQ